jgi:hypothetical protein
MRCAQAEKLIPLYAGDDLPGEQTVELRGHLESCAQCQRLVVEFEESRNWLINCSAPEFDEATLAGVRDRALEEIGRIEKRPGLAEWILPGWNPRFVFAASMALLLIAVSALIVYRQQKSPMARPGEMATDNRKNKSEDPPGIDRENRRPSNESKVANARPGSHKPPRKSFEPDLHKSPQVKIQPVEPESVLIAQTSTTDQPVNPEPSTNDLAENRNMLRIEIQTADPNIRIIWLAPTDSNSNRPNTNVR